MMPPRKVKQAKKNDQHDEHKKSQKAKGVRHGGTMGMGRGHDEDNSGNPNPNIDEGRLMQAKPIKKKKIDQASQEHGGTKKPVS